MQEGSMFALSRTSNQDVVIKNWMSAELSTCMSLVEYFLAMSSCTSRLTDHYAGMRGKPQTISRLRVFQRCEEERESVLRILRPNIGILDSGLSCVVMLRYYCNTQLAIFATSILFSKTSCEVGEMIFYFSRILVIDKETETRLSKPLYTDNNI